MQIEDEVLPGPTPGEAGSRSMFEVAMPGAEKVAEGRETHPDSQHALSSPPVLLDTGDVSMGERADTISFDFCAE